MQDTVKKNPDVVWREEQAGMDKVVSRGCDEEIPCLTLVYLGTMYQLNFMAAEIWKLIDGARGVDEISKELLPRYEVSFDILRKDIASFMEDMLAKGWLVKA